MNATYCGPPPLPDAVWATWNLDLPLIAGLVVLALVLRRNACGLAAVVVLAVAFVSPLCPLSSALFSARAVHHVLLVAVAAPLFACAAPAQRANSTALAFAVSTATLWVWHVPAAYDLALSNVAAYWLMQLTLLVSAIWFWRCVFARAASPVNSLLFIVASFAQMGMLGAVLTFAPQPLYAAHVAAPFAFAMTPLDDQALGGLIMWVPAAIPYAIAGALVARRGWALFTRRSVASC